MLRTIGLLLLLSGILHGQRYPVDSLLTGSDNHIARKIFITPIALFQRISFTLPILNCQYEPCCSHYTAMAITRYGIPRGLVMGADRIVRCNPYAVIHYSLEHPDDFQLNFPLPDPLPTDRLKRIPTWRTPLSVVPGLGRVCQGRFGDGLASFFAVSSFARATRNMAAQEKPVWSGFFGGLTLLFWTADFYSTFEPRPKPPEVPYSQYYSFDTPDIYH